VILSPRNPSKINGWDGPRLRLQIPIITILTIRTNIAACCVVFGQSSILCAICLGLGGEPRLLGRASELETFIQTGKDYAEIELEVVNENEDENDIIRRVITKKGNATTTKNNREGAAGRKSTFTWNGVDISGKRVREKVSKEFQIQIDNLCTFLPQEKVGNFSGFDSRALLLETEKTLSKDNYLYNTHMELIELQEELHGGDDLVDSLQVKLRDLELESTRLEGMVHKMEARQRAEEQADLLRKKILWLRHDQVHQECLELKESKEEIKRQHEEVQEKWEPLVLAHDVAKERLEKLNEEYNEFDREIQKHKKEMDKQKQKYETYDDQIEEAHCDLITIDKHRAELESMVEIHKERIQKLQMDPFASVSVDEHRASLEQAKKDQNAIRPVCSSTKRDYQELLREAEGLKQEIDSERKKLATLQDTTVQRQLAVFRWAPEVKRAYDWLHGHRDMFRHPVLGPIAADISPKSNNAAAYLEQHVPNSTLKSFVVQSKADYDLLYQKVREEQGIPINIIQVDRENGSRRRMYSDQTMEMLKRDHGIIGYLDEAIVAPPSILDALKSSASIDKVLIGNDASQESMDNRGLGDILTQPEYQGGPLRGYCIFTSNRGQSFKYTSHISKYSNKPSIRVDDIRPPKVLRLGASEDAEQRVMQELNVKEGRMAELQPTIDETKARLEEMTIQAQQSQQLVMDITNQIREADSWRNKLQVVEHKLREAESQLSVDNDHEKQEKIDKLNHRIRLSVKVLTSHSDSYKKMMLTTVKASGARLSKEAATVEERLAG
jgi:chromosome segregation ATPase